MKETNQSDITTSAGFEQIYRAHVRTLCKIAFRQTKNFSEAESIVQSVFLSLWERRSSLKITGSVENYLIGAVKLAVMDKKRKRAVRQERLEHHLADYCNSSCCTENTLAYQELCTTVDQLTDRLPCQCKNIYELSRVKGFNNKEIASKLLISEKTVEAHLTKALKFLRARLPQYQACLWYWLLTCLE